ncbi:MAG TPA: hypothetical protein VGE07_30845, partial [Herpetosiphonaceae bacterium]
GDEERLRFAGGAGSRMRARRPRIALAAGAALVALLGAGAWRSASSQQRAAPQQATADITLTGVGKQRLRIILPIVSAAPAPPADLAGGALDSDGFDSPRWAVARDRGWSLGYTDGRYQMRMDPGVGILWSYSKQDAPAGDLALAIDFEPRAGQAGLIFGWRGSRDHYRLVAGADGGYRLEQRRGGEVIVHLSGQGAGAGRLAVALRGAQARVYFNQQLLGEVALPSAPGGRYGMVVVSEGAGEASFDTLSLQTIP